MDTQHSSQDGNHSTHMRKHVLGHRELHIRGTHFSFLFMWRQVYYTTGVCFDNLRWQHIKLLESQSKN